MSMNTSHGSARRLVSVAAAVACAAAIGFAQADPINGTWKLNADKSTSGTGRPNFTQTLTFAVSSDLESYRSEVVNAQGTTQITVYKARYDGKPYPSTVTSSERPGETAGDEVVLRKVDDRTRERIVRRDGRVVRIMQRTLSADGRTLTSVLTDIDPSGARRIASTLVYEKQ
jgi:hypothetical protein